MIKARRAMDASSAAAAVAAARRRGITQDGVRSLGRPAGAVGEGIQVYKQYTRTLVCCVGGVSKVNEVGVIRGVIVKLYMRRGCSLL